MTDYVALKGILQPGTSVFGYQRGHAVPAEVVESWNLVVDDDVAEGTSLPADGEAAVARPAEGANRADLESYAVATGALTQKQAAEASQDDLEAVATAEDQPPSEQGEQLVRPADSAAKADWVAYALAQGADPQWANDSATTKANLQAYEPPVGDTVAESATEANGQPSGESPA
jgi:hypothetical protein